MFQAKLGTVTSSSIACFGERDMAGNCSCPYSASYLLSLNSRVLHRSYSTSPTDEEAKTSCSDLPDLYAAVGLSQNSYCINMSGEMQGDFVFTYEDVNLFQCSWACQLNAQSGGITYQFCTSTTGSSWPCAGTHRSEWITMSAHGELPGIQPYQYLLACSVSGNHHVIPRHHDEQLENSSSLFITADLMLVPIL